MAKIIEADSITFTSHDGRCSLRLEAGEHHVGIFMTNGNGTRFVSCHSDDRFELGPIRDEQPDPPAIDVTFEPAVASLTDAEFDAKMAAEVEAIISKQIAASIDLPESPAPLSESNAGLLVP